MRRWSACLCLLSHETSPEGDRNCGEENAFLHTCITKLTVKADSERLKLQQKLQKR